MNEAYVIGQVDALSGYGLSKNANARLIGTALGGITGAALAPDDKEWQAAFLGATAGYGLGALGSRDWANTKADFSELGAALRERAGRARAWFQKKPAAPPSVSNPPFALTKQSDFSGGVGVGIPGTPLSVSLGGGSKDEILPGMHQWVPRATLERLHKMRDAGWDNTAVLQAEGERGRYTHPLMGALAAGAAAHKWLPNSGGFSKALLTTLGAGAGGLYHQATQDQRMQQAQEALRGVDIQRMQEQRMYHDLGLLRTPTGDAR